jgi:uroporphyrinogen-III decarboxylase
LKIMNHRDRFFALLEGRPVDRVPFFPDIQSWYDSRRVPAGLEQKYGPGSFIPDDDPYHKARGTMPAEYADWTFLDFYRRFDWGLPVHLYGWCKTERVDCELADTTRGRERETILRTPKGDLRKTARLAEDGSWAPHEHFVKTLDDLAAIRWLVAHERRVPLAAKYHRFIKATEGYGVCDITIHRSPFGKLVHEYMGFEQVIYALADDEARVQDFLAFQEQYDLELIKIAAAFPARLVIISDHADENLISPPYYKKYCIPYYQKACAILHEAGKFVSTHLDGNFNGFHPFIGETHFDLLDGCTPAPMFNYEVEELAAALKTARFGATGGPLCGKMHAFCGVPSTLFTQGRPTAEINAFGKRIVKAFNGRVILNIGDVLPQNGDLAQVIALGAAAGGAKAKP